MAPTFDTGPATLSRPRLVPTRPVARCTSGRPACRLVAIALLAWLLAAGLVGAARAATQTARLAGAVPFGVGDENPSMFFDPRFAWLGVHQARLIVPWDVMRHRAQLDRAALWLETARAAKVEPLVSFNQSVAHPSALPRVSAYAATVSAFMRRFPWVTHYETWDEENEASEPTSHDPARAARYFNWLSGACRGCRVAAADLLDGPSMEEWVSRFAAYARQPQIWGLHPYLELLYGGRVQLSRLLDMTHGQIWLTEAGLPVWRFVRTDRQFRFTGRADQLRAARRLLTISRSSWRISRIYYYQWRSSSSLSASRAQYRRHRRVTVTWDSGLFNPGCTIRPIFTVIARALGRSAAHAPRVRRADHGFACKAAG
jgi:hypothetical protein